jgi:hypothetical protein
MKEKESNKKILIAVLVILMVLLGIAAVFIGIKLATTPEVTPTEGKAAPDNLIFPAASYYCSGSCESGAECNQYGDPPPGKMWSCWSQTCSYEDVNSGGSSCYLDCQTGWSPCGCDVSECEDRCMDTIGPGESGTYTMLCDNCRQKFSCDCEKPGVSNTPTNTPTSTPTSTPTNTPTGTPTKTPTGTPSKTVTPTVSKSITPTPTLPPTALISDEADMIVFGLVFIILGAGMYKMGMLNIVESALWYLGGREFLGKYKTKYFSNKLDSERADFEEKFD